METYNKNTDKELTVYNLLKEVMDPEIGINIIDLGLVYLIEASDERIDIEMTLTSPGCPLGDVILENTENHLQQHFQDHKINIALVWEPAWEPTRITDEGRKELGYE